MTWESKYAIPSSTTSSMMKALESQTYSNIDKIRFMSATEKKTNAFFFNFIVLTPFPN